MLKNRGPESIEQLMAEADELVLQRNSNAIKDIKEEHRLQVEKYAQTLKKNEKNCSRALFFLHLIINNNALPKKQGSIHIRPLRWRRGFEAFWRLFFYAGIGER